MDSLCIAMQLETIYPDKGIHLDTNLHLAVEPIIGSLAKPLSAIFVPRMLSSVLPESSRAWFEASRTARLGMSLENFARLQGGRQAWDNARAGLDAMENFLTEHQREGEPGPFVLGSQISYVDFVIVGFVQSIKRIGEDIFGELMENLNLRRHYEACSAMGLLLKDQ